MYLKEFSGFFGVNLKSFFWSLQLQIQNGDCLFLNFHPSVLFN